MDTIKLLVQGSEDIPYTVTFAFNAAGNLTAFCTCAAGENGQSCKHRLNIFAGNFENIVGDNASSASTVIEWLEGSNIASGLQALVDAERELAGAKARVSRAKNKLGIAMREGSYP